MARANAAAPAGPGVGATIRAALGRLWNGIVWVGRILLSFVWFCLRNITTVFWIVVAAVVVWAGWSAYGWWTKPTSSKIADAASSAASTSVDLAKAAGGKVADLAKSGMDKVRDAMKPDPTPVAGATPAAAPAAAPVATPAPPQTFSAEQLQKAMDEAVKKALASQKAPAPQAQTAAPAATGGRRLVKSSPPGCHAISVGGKTVEVVGMEGKPCFSHQQIFANASCTSLKAKAEPSGKPAPYQFHFVCLPPEV